MWRRSEGAILWSRGNLIVRLELPIARGKPSETNFSFSAFPNFSISKKALNQYHNKAISRRIIQVLISFLPMIVDLSVLSE
jgi:hypothetical protein